MRDEALDPRLAWLTRAIAVALAAAAAAAAAWALVTLSARPLDGVEGDVLFEADRVRAGLALWVDPTVGAHDYGAVPARYHVLYPPLWSATISLVPSAWSHIVARAVALAAWLVALGLVVRCAPPSRRRLVALGALFVLGSFHLTMYVAAGRPDAVAVSLAVVALARACRRGRADVWVGVLFAVAVWTKPNVLGLAAGVALASIARPGLGSLLAGGLGASAIIGGVLHAASRGAFVTHLLASTMQAPSGALWSAQVHDRAPFFAIPLALAGLLAWRGRRDGPTRIAGAALLASTAWALVSFAKIGSAANYLLEPAGAALLVLAYAPPEALRVRSPATVGIVLALQVAWTSVASVRSTAERVPLAFAQAKALADVRAACAGPDAVILADEPGLERMLNGRIVATPFQSTHLARRGALPVAPWLSDVRAPEVRCLVMQDDLLERPPERVSLEHDRFGAELRAALRSRFALAWTRAGLRFYTARR
jgi:hypothetical protein